MKKTQAQVKRIEILTKHCSSHNSPLACHQPPANLPTRGTTYYCSSATAKGVCPCKPDLTNYPLLEFTGQSLSYLMGQVHFQVPGTYIIGR